MSKRLKYGMVIVMVLAAASPARAQYWTWEESPAWTSSGGASVSAHLVDVVVEEDPNTFEYYVKDFTIGYVGSGLDDDRMQFSILTLNGEPEFDSFQLDSTSPNPGVTFFQSSPDTLGSPDLGQSITNTRSDTGSFYIEFTHTLQNPGILAEDGTKIVDLFWVHWSDSDVTVDSSQSLIQPFLVQREGTRVLPAVDTTVSVNGLLNGQDFDQVNGALLRPGVVFALQSTDEWLTHLETMPGSLVRVAPGGDAVIGDYDDRSIILQGDLEVQDAAYLNFHSQSQAMLYGDVSTDGGGLRSESGIRIGSTDISEALSDDYFDAIGDAMFSLLGEDPAQIQAQQMLSEAAQMMGQITEMVTNVNEIQMAVIRGGGFPTFDAIDSLQTQQPHQNLSDLQREVTQYTTEANQAAMNVLNQMNYRSTITGDVSLSTEMVVGGEGDIEQVQVIGNVDIDAFSILRFDIARDEPGTEHDVLAIEGDLDLEHFITLALNFTDAGGDPWMPDFGESWELIVADRIINPAVFLIDAPVWDDRLIMAGVVDLPSGQQAVRAVTIVTIPEPGTLAVLGVAATVLARRRCRREASHG